VLALLCAPALAQPDERDVAVHIQRDGPRIIVDVRLPVAATALETWAVATDYDHMASFVTNLEESRVLSRDNNRLRIFQKGRASRGLLTFTFENVRELDLVPGREVHSRLVSGDLKESEFLTQIVEQGGVVHILNSGRFIPNMWVPPLIGPPIIAAETRKQFGEIRTEILRRQTLAAAAGSMPTPAPAP